MFKLHSIQQLGAVLALGLFLAPGLARAADELAWQHKDWQVYTEHDSKGKKRCTAMGGGDGSDMFYVSATPGGDLSVYYQEQTYRGMKPAMKKSDSYIFKLDDKQQTVFDDVQVFLDVDEEGIPRAIASMPSGYGAEAVKALRGAGSVTVLREDARTRKQVLVQKFSLAGFTATFLKAAEWCGFDPNKLKTP